MRLFRKEVWSYAVLLIILFCIAALAVLHILESLENIPAVDYAIIALQIWSLTMGFMFIAGAFGLWAIQFAAEAESRRQIGNLVNAMDYLQDGLIVIDKKHRISGSNPAAKIITGSNIATNQRLENVFTNFSKEDIALLLDASHPEEIEQDFDIEGNRRTLRIRSQPAENLTILLISDVTMMNAQRRRQRQSARMQLIGQLARGFAHDFTNLLCIMSGNAGVIERQPAGSAEHKAAINSIIKSAEHGISMAAHLQALTDGLDLSKPAKNIGEHVEAASSNLRASLPDTWNITTETENHIFPPCSLSGIQIEQAVTNLGLLAADSAPAPGNLNIILHEPDKYPLFDVGKHFCAVIAIRTGITDVNAITNIPTENNTVGAIESMIRSIIEEGNGMLDVFHAPDGSTIYRIALPVDPFIANADSVPAGPSKQLPQAMAVYLSGWKLLLAIAQNSQNKLLQRLNEIGVKFETTDNLISVLSLMESTEPPDGLIIDTQLLEAESIGILNAVRKLFPRTGIIVLSDPENTKPLPEKIKNIPRSTAADGILAALLEAHATEG